MIALITGSGGLLGSELSRKLLDAGNTVVGIDKDQRGRYFGEDASTLSVIDELKAINGYTHEWMDVRHDDETDFAVRQYKPDLVVNCAAQPAHDYSCENPVLDFEVNARGALNVYESCRKHRPEAVVIQMSTNKVYGDGVNRRLLRETESRFTFLDETGVDESAGLDGCIHSPYGANKLAADILAQEYARYYGMKVGIFRAGCITGERHGAVPLHGFLAYLVKCVVKGIPYTVVGYGGKQVRDQIHASDLADGLLRYAAEPRPGEVYNVGGGFNNSLSILEAIDLVERKSGKKLSVTHNPTPRRGDHVCYYSDNRKFESHYGPLVHIGVDEIVERLVRWWESK